MIIIRRISNETIIPHSVYRNLFDFDLGIDERPTIKSQKTEK